VIVAVASAVARLTLRSSSSAAARLIIFGRVSNLSCRSIASRGSCVMALRAADFASCAAVESARTAASKVASHPSTRASNTANALTPSRSLGATIGQRVAKACRTLTRVPQLI